MLNEAQLDPNTRPDDGMERLDAFADRYSEAVRRLRRATHSSLWDTGKPAPGAPAEKKKTTRTQLLARS